MTVSVDGLDSDPSERVMVVPKVAPKSEWGTGSIREYVGKLWMMEHYGNPLLLLHRPLEIPH